ncbi:hypothetical protein IKJ53_01830 [bacterium]|nr:hypothetical protein [bacterium]
MKKLLWLFATFLLLIGITYAYEYSSLPREYDGVELPVNTFIPVIALQDFSTAYSDETNELRFVCNNPVHLFEEVVVPKGTMFYGYIEKKNEPIIGTHASMVVRITKMVYIDGHTVPLRAYIHTPNGNKIGGGLTQPEKYDTVPHYHKRICKHFVGVLQWVPGPARKMGEHVTVSAGTQLLVVLVAPAYITHTLTN